jgi:hypothetical protein
MRWKANEKILKPKNWFFETAAKLINSWLLIFKRENINHQSKE